MSRFREALRSGRVLLMDGAMGTELQRAGIRKGECYEHWNLTHPEQVRQIHQGYADAGATVFLTNTFQVVTASIAPGRLFRSPARYEETLGLIALQWSAYALARSVCGSQGLVLADVGSYDQQSTGWEFSDLSLLKRAVAWVGHADGLLLETCSTPRVRLAVKAAIRFGTGIPVLLSLTFRRHRSGMIETRSGQSPEWFAQRARAWGVSALGVNCGRDIGMDEIIEIIRRYREATDLPLFARPNAGTPTRDGQRWVYPHTPAQMAARVPELLDAGVCMVGGCCGTTPEHIAAFRPVVEAWNARRPEERREEKGTGPLS
jgi:methionine synthase I (cobalamin-dependent)